MNSYLQLLSQSEKLAKAFAESGNYGKAFAHLLVCLTVSPNKKHFEEFFTKVTICFGNQLCKEGRRQDLISTFTSAIEEYPNNATLLNSFGTFLVRLGNIEYAYKIMNQALSLHPNSLICNRNMCQIKDMLVPRWHFRMLNDHVRNTAYRNAILKQISLGYDNILDIGTGTGLLSLFASECNPKSIQACDYSQTMVDIAKNVFESNNIHNINLLNISSFEIDSDNFKKVSLIVTEILDSGIFGENLINSVVHAAENLTLSDWNIVPCGITVHITAIESESIFRKTRLRNGTLSGLSTTKLAAYSNDTLPYDTENLRNIDDVKYLTKVEILYELDLKSKSLKETLLEQKSIVMKCIDNGYVDAFAIWMTLKLDEENIITSDPRVKEGIYCCWDQAIYPVKQKFYIEKDYNFIIGYSCEDGTTLNIKHEFLVESECSLPLPSFILEFLNNEIYLEKLKETQKSIQDNYINTRNVLDLSPFPIMGIRMLMENNAKKLVIKDCKEDVKNFIQLITNINGLENDSVIFCDLENIVHNETFDVIIFEWLQETGEFSDELQIQAKIMQFLSPGGITIPHRIEIRGLLIESKWLNFISKVSDTNVNNFRIAEYINKYHINKHIDFQIDSFDYNECSKIINLGILNSNATYMTNNKEVPVTCQCSLNGIFYWYDIILFKSGISYCTKNKHSHIKNAAFIFDEINCNIFDKVTTKVLQDDGILKINICKYN